MTIINNIKTWNDLNEVLFQESWNDKIERYRLSYVFRGLSDIDYDLQTSLIRLGGTYDKLEKNLLRNFKKYAHNLNIKENSIWELMAIAQHHGLPTRLLDWTYSPYIALHFMTANLNHFDRDGVIWCVDLTKTIAYLPMDMKDILDEEQAQVFTVDMLTKTHGSIESFDQSKKDDFIVFFEPPSIDSRILNQFALFSVMSNPKTVLNEWLVKHTNVYKKIIIPAHLKWEIRDKLDQLNISERMLFPGLDGLCSWLKRYYSPKNKG